MNNSSVHMTNEISREELIKTFEILHEKGLLSYNELQNAISLSIKRYKSINQLNLQ